jgi:hypothetical protein
MSKITEGLVMIGRKYIFVYDLFEEGVEHTPSFPCAAGVAETAETAETSK